MTNVSVEGLSLREAERKLADLWYLLELHEVETPRCRVTTASGAVAIRLSFHDSADAAMVKRALSLAPPAARAAVDTRWNRCHLTIVATS
jgi:hypothetical protein